MAQTEYTGADMMFTWNSKKLTGLQKVNLNEEGGPAPEPLPATVEGDTTYQTIPDPLGAKGKPKAKITVTLQDSTASYADATQTKFAFNSAQTGVFDSANGVANANTWTHTTLELTERTTEIFWNAYAICTLVFEANAVGAWTGPA